MISRHLRLIIALLLPLMTLRGLLPAGYMAGMQNGELRIVMCSDGLQGAAKQAPQNHSGQHASDDACPFAMAAALAPPPAARAFEFTAPAAPTAYEPAQRARPALSLPHPTARGPPDFS